MRAWAVLAMAGCSFPDQVGDPKVLVVGTGHDLVARGVGAAPRDVMNVISDDPTIVAVVGVVSRAVTVNALSEGETTLRYSSDGLDRYRDVRVIDPVRFVINNDCDDAIVDLPFRLSFSFADSANVLGQGSGWYPASITGGMLDAGASTELSFEVDLGGSNATIASQFGVAAETTVNVQPASAISTFDLRALPNDKNRMRIVFGSTSAYWEAATRKHQTLASETLAVCGATRARVVATGGIGSCHLVDDLTNEIRAEIFPVTGEFTVYTGGSPCTLQVELLDPPFSSIPPKQIRFDPAPADDPFDEEGGGSGDLD